jgi:hypothetical protein
LRKDFNPVLFYPGNPAFLENLPGQEFLKGSLSGLHGCQFFGANQWIWINPFDEDRLIFTFLKPFKGHAIPDTPHVRHHYHWRTI